jgi:hypothetical protein
MTLSELVKLRNDFAKYSSLEHITPHYIEYNNNLTALLNEAGHHAEGIVRIRETAKASANQFTELVNASVKQVLAEIQQEINEIGIKYLNKEEFTATVEQDRKTRTLPMPDEIRDILFGRIRLYADWHYPGLELGPHDGEFTGNLVGCDPLYIADVHQEYLESAATQFPPEYRARMRPYSIGHMRLDNGFVDLPQNEFGFIFSWNYFNYLPLSEIMRYLTGMVPLLRPGGIMLFSYNDSDSFHGAQHVEWGGMGHTPKSKMIPMVEALGLTVVDSHGFETSWHNISWLECKKPGTLSTIKAHQAIGIIEDI